MTEKIEIQLLVGDCGGTSAIDLSVTEEQLRFLKEIERKIDDLPPGELYHFMFQVI